MTDTSIKVASFDKLIINSFIEKYNLENKENKIITASMSLFSSRQSFSVLQFQPETELIVDPDKGIFSNNREEFIRKYNAFFDLSFSETYVLVLTPEYSVPRESLEYLIDNERNIKPGVLYCICCEGMLFKEYESLCKSITDKFDIVFNDTIVKNILPDRLVCVMFYLTKIRFTLENRDVLDQVFLVPQFKVNQMRDPNFDFETAGLTLGNTLLYLGEENGPKFMSMICADSYNLEVIQNIQAFGDNDLLVFNPQLNQGVNNAIFKHMRSNLFEYCKDRVRIISLNWAKNTKLFLNGNESKLNTSKSGYYFEFEKTEFENILNIYPKNTFCGFEFNVEEKIGFWEAYGKENATAYLIDSFKIAANPRFATNNRELRANTLWIYDNNKFKSASKVCEKEIASFFKEHQEFEELLKCNNCTKTSCSKCNLNEFSASIFDKNLIEEYVTLDADAEGVISEKIIICKKILNMLKSGVVSYRFKFVNKKIKFVIQKSHDLTFNVLFIDNDDHGEENIIPCRLVFLKYTEKHLAIKKYKDLQKKYGEEKKDSIMVFYESEDGCKVIPEKNNTNIVNTQIPETNSDII